MSGGVAGTTRAGSIDAQTAPVVAERVQVLSSASRVQILGWLREGACSVGELADAVGMGASAVPTSCVSCAISGS
jgi:ArsR family transcriptional regulator, nickel/cobalt-responsive transcriptional repressor